MPGTESLPGTTRARRERDALRDRVAANGRRPTTPPLRLSLASLLLLPALVAADPAKPNVVVLLCRRPRVRRPRLLRPPEDQDARDRPPRRRGVELDEPATPAAGLLAVAGGAVQRPEPEPARRPRLDPTRAPASSCRAETVTVAQRLKAAGYTTCLSGKWHLNSKFNGREPTPGDFGFDHWFATQNNADPATRTRRTSSATASGSARSRATRRTLIVDEAIGFIDRRRGAGRSRVRHVPRPARAGRGARGVYDAYADVPDPTKRDYYGSVSLIDHEVGRLVEVLDAEQLRRADAGAVHQRQRARGAPRYPNAEPVARLGRARCGG